MNRITSAYEPCQTVRASTPSGRHLVIIVLAGTAGPWLAEKIPLLMSGEEGVPVRSSAFASVRRFEDPLTKEILYYKEFHDRGVMDKIKKLFLPCRGKRAFQAGHLLLGEGFHSPLPVAYGEERRFGYVTRNFLLTEGVEAEISYDYFSAHFTAPLAPEALLRKRPLLSKAGAEIGRLHRRGLFHGDLRAGNVMIRGQGPEAEFFFIDNERTRKYRTLPDSKRLKNLVQLNLVPPPQMTRTDKMRFLRAYLRENPSLIPQKKALIGSISRLTETRLRKREKRTSSRR